MPFLSHYFNEGLGNGGNIVWDMVKENIKEPQQTKMEAKPWVSGRTRNVALLEKEDWHRIAFTGARYLDAGDSYTTRKGLSN